MCELSNKELAGIENSLTENLDHLIALGFMEEISAIPDNEEDFSPHFPEEKSDADIAKELLQLIPED